MQNLSAGSSFFPMWITARKQDPVWRASIDALTPSRPSKVWVMYGSNVISPLMTA
jgi:hypothetical protein